MSSASVVLSGPSLPARLFDLDPPPAVLYVRGELPRCPAVALVGTRHASPEGLNFTRELAGELARRGVAVLSGGAQGIDTAAHQGAVDAGGITVVVAPSGYDQPYPPDNRELYARVLEVGGAYVSLVADDVHAERHRFFRRNACLAALAHALVVVEADYRSGARNAAAAARRLGRQVYAVPHAPWNPKGRGCNTELRLGARVLESARDVLSGLELLRLHPLALPGLPPHSEAPARRGSSQLDLPYASNEEDRVLGEVAKGAAHPDEICTATGLPAARVQALVLTLTLKGALVPGPDGRLRAREPVSRFETSPWTDPPTNSEHPETTNDFD